MTLLGRGICKNVEYVNVRGNQCAQSHYGGQRIDICASRPQIDSFHGGCSFASTQSAVSSENNFGCYFDEWIP